MINSQNLITKICDKINLGGLTSLETCQTDNALSILNCSTSIVKCVTTFSNLPNANDYDGRMIYVGNENRYYHSVSGVWINKLDSEIYNYANRLFLWGCNGQGRLGDYTTIDRSSPVSVVGGFTDWCQVSAGCDYSLGVTSNGTLWAWGVNTGGILGNNCTINRSSPVSVAGGFTDWKQVSAGWCHSIGIRTNGTAWGWGDNGNGKLGDDTTINRSSPVSVVGGFTDWCQVGAGAAHSLGVKYDGTLWAWGCNVVGQLGDNTSTNRSSPVSVVGGFTDWCQVSAGGQSLGVRTNGTAWAWGCNVCGRLGDNTTIHRSSPISIVGGFTDWCQLSAGQEHSLGVRTNGTIWGWGDNGQGRLGDNTAIARSSPVSVVGGFTDWCQVSAGAYRSLGVRTNGTAWAWGRNQCGQLGDNTTISRSSPVLVVGGFTDWYRVSEGFATKHNVGIRFICKGL